jgi:hypothetical protein
MTWNFQFFYDSKTTFAVELYDDGTSLKQITFIVSTLKSNVGFIKTASKQLYLMKLNILPKKIPGDASADVDEEEEEGLAPAPFFEFLIATVNKRNLHKQNVKSLLKLFFLCK